MCVWVGVGQAADQDWDSSDEDDNEEIAALKRVSSLSVWWQPRVELTRNAHSQARRRITWDMRGRRGDERIMGTYKEQLEMELEVPGLKPGVLYQFRVAAVNAVGEGIYSEDSLSSFTRSVGTREWGPLAHNSPCHSITTLAHTSV